MAEVHTGRPETETVKTNGIDFEAARHKRQAGEKSQRHRPLTPPPSREDREERHTAARQQRIKEELGKTPAQATDGQGQQQTAWTPEDDALVNEILYGNSDQENTRARTGAARERLDKLAAEKGWEAVADTLWKRVGTFNAEYGRKYDYPVDPTQRKLPDKADTRERINNRLARADIRPLRDEEWSEWERMREVDPATLAQEEWQRWRRNPASLTEEAVRDLEAYHQETAPSKEWLDRFEEEEGQKRWEKIAVPDFAKRLGLDPDTLTAEERKKLASYDPETLHRTQWLGLNPFTLTPEQQKELGTQK